MKRFTSSPKFSVGDKVVATHSSGIWEGEITYRAEIDEGVWEYEVSNAPQDRQNDSYNKGFYVPPGHRWLPLLWEHELTPLPK